MEPHLEEMFTTTGFFARSKYGTAAFVQRNAPTQ